MKTIDQRPVPPENIRKAKAFWGFQSVQDVKIGVYRGTGV